MSKLVIVGLLSALIGGAMGAAGGGVVGYTFGSTTGERNQYRLALRDGRAMFAAVEEASPILQHVRDELEHGVRDSEAGAEVLERLARIKRPLDASLFLRRRYMAFQQGTVDAVFRYYMDVVLIWDGLQRLLPLAAELRSSDETKRVAAQRDVAVGMATLRGYMADALRLEAALRSDLGKIAALRDP